MHMPIMDGMAATRHIRSSGLTFPVVALTALGSDEERQACLDEGCNAFLPKPIRLDSMMKTLGQFLEVDDTAETNGQNAEELSGTPSLPTPALNADNTNNDVKNSPSDVADVEEEGLIYSNLPDDEEFNEIISDFIALLPAKFAEFDAALESNDTDRLRKLGHWLAGSSGTVGFFELVDPGRQFESCHPQQFATLIAKCKAISKRVVVSRKPIGN